MQTFYSKNNESVQKKTDSTVSTVLDNSSQSESLQRKAEMMNNAAQREETPRPNNTGMPDNLKAGIESLSGFSMDDVRVHYNSSKPATVQALAYTQGTDIHVAPGQEKHLPHEAWHVAQQMAGRVSPTTNINGMPVNDNAGLAHEADVMGAKAVGQKKSNICEKRNIPVATTQCVLSEADYVRDVKQIIESFLREKKLFKFRDTIKQWLNQETEKVDKSNCQKYLDKYYEEGKFGLGMGENEIYSIPVDGDGSCTDESVVNEFPKKIKGLYLFRGDGRNPKDFKETMSSYIGYPGQTDIFGYLQTIPQIELGTYGRQWISNPNNPFEAIVNSCKMNLIKTNGRFNGLCCYLNKDGFVGSSYKYKIDLSSIVFILQNPNTTASGVGLYSGGGINIQIIKNFIGGCCEVDIFSEIPTDKVTPV